MSANYGEQFTFAVREYLQANGLKSLGQINAKVLADIAQRFHEKFMGAQKKRKVRPAFVPPTPEEVTAYSIAIGYPLDGEGWCAKYEQKGWFVGDKVMVSWKAAVVNWKKSGWTIGATPGREGSSGEERGSASLGALIMQLKAVETELEGLLYKGGSAYKATLYGDELARAHSLAAQRKAIKKRMDEFHASGDKVHQHEFTQTA